MSTDAKKDLGKKLANHFLRREFEGFPDKSTPEPTSGDSGPTQGAGIPRPMPAGIETRIIAIVGAGASFSAGLPLGQKLKCDLFEELTSGPHRLLDRSGVLLECGRSLHHAPMEGLEKVPALLETAEQNPNEQAVTRALTELEDLLINRTKFDLLRFCESLSPYRAVLNFMQEYIARRLVTTRTCPVLAYELLAHLLNHRFVDHIISLNFDTLLDESLHDEMGDEGVNSVISDRDVTGAQHGIGDKACYFKPHGSIDYPESLRFTLRHTAGVHHSVLSLIRRALFGRRPKDINLPGAGEESSPDSRDPLVLIIMGWAGCDKEFRQILKDGASQIESIYWFCTKEDLKKSSALSVALHDIRPLLRGKIHRITFGDKNTPDLNHALLKVVGQIGNHGLVNGVSLPPVSRHLLYCSCFPSLKSSQQTSYDDEPTLAAERLRFEIFYHSLKTKGSFSTHNMSQIRRIQKSLKRFADLKEDRLKALSDIGCDRTRDVVVSCFGSDGIKPEEGENYAYIPGASPKLLGVSLEHVLKYFWSKCLRNPNSSMHLAFRDMPIKAPRAVLDYGKMFQESLNSQLRHSNRDNDGALAESLAYHLERVRGMTETEINPRPGARHWWLFSNPLDIRTISELRQWTLYYLAKRNWNSLWIIAETGEWLTDKALSAAIRERIRADKDQKFRIKIIVAQERPPAALGGANLDTLETEYTAEFHNQVELDIRALHWWMHNRHMTIFLDSNETPVTGIYFRRRLKTPLIHPIRLTDQEDLAQIKAIFERYMRKCR